MNIYINPSLEDPFNSPKQWILLVSSGWLIGVVYLEMQKFSFKSNKDITLLLLYTLSFLSVMLVLAAITDNTYTAFVGDAFRKLGFFTYFGLAIFMICASLIANFSNIKNFFIAALIVSIIVGLYGILQATGNDFFEWNNPYNAVIGTVGNPNFASANFAVLSVVCLSMLFNSVFKIKWKALSFSALMLLLFSIVRSDSRQGLISFCVGALFLLIFKAYAFSKRTGIFALIAIIILSVLGILGMLQVGPLEKYLYKDSLSIRGFYWRAGIEMFKENVLTGVGIDRYGAYFRAYREVEYPLRYGFDITTSNAHNVPIHFFATGGLFLGVTYLLLLLFVLSKIVKSIRGSKGENRNNVVALSAAWLSYQAQSVISIDNIGLSIWGWVIAGLIIGLANDIQRSKNQHNINNQTLDNVTKDIARLLISGASSLIFIILISFPYRGETYSIQARTLYDPNKSIQSDNFYVSVDRALKVPGQENFYKIQLAMQLSSSGDNSKSFEIINKILEADPRSWEALQYKAYLLERSMQYSEAVLVRQRIAIIDPWNAKNYLEMGVNYKKINDTLNMEKMLSKIESFAKSTPEYELAKIKLK
jgi:O-antigen ligase